MSKKKNRLSLDSNPGGQKVRPLPRRSLDQISKLNQLARWRTQHVSPSTKDGKPVRHAASEDLIIPRKIHALLFTMIYTLYIFIYLGS